MTQIAVTDTITSAVVRAGLINAVAEMKAVVLGRENIEPHHVIFFDRAVSDIRDYEFGTHREDLAPPLDPPLGITPVTFRGESDLRERIGVFRFRADDLHLFCRRRPVGGVGLGYAAP